MKIKLLLVLNNINWLSIYEKVKFIKSFFSPKFDFEIEIKYTKFQNIPYETVKSSSMIDEVEVLRDVPAIRGDWYNQNITSLALDKQIVLFYAGDQSIQGHPPAIQQNNNEGPVEITIFKFGEHDRAYQKGVKDLGDAFSVWACHEISHALKKMFKVSDDTHEHFYNGNPRDVLNNLNIGQLDFISIIIAGIKRALTFMGILINDKIDDGSIPVKLVSDSTEEGWKPADVLYDWDTPEKARHSVRVICDEEGLTTKDKNDLCATVGAESGWKPRQKSLKPNFDGTYDHGIIQLNEKYWIGEGKLYPNIEAVYNDPEGCIRWMCKQWKLGNKNWWYAYKNLSYKKFL